MDTNALRKIKETRTFYGVSHDVQSVIQAFGISRFQNRILIFVAGVLLTTATATSSYGQADLAQPVQSQDGLPNTVFISANSTVHELTLKHMNTNGQVSKVSGFKIDMAKVALINPSSPNINAFSNDPSLTMIGAKLRANSQGFNLQGTANTYSLAGLAQGVYTLDVIAQKGSNQGAYETILVIGPAMTPQIQNVVQQKIVQETNVDVDTDIFYPKPPRVDDKYVVCLYHPEDPICKPGSDGKCPSGWGTNEEGQCFPADKECPTGYWRADDDESGACVPRTTAAAALIDDSALPPCDGSLQDCVTEGGDVCEAGSTEHECELDETQGEFIEAPTTDGEEFDFYDGDEIEVDEDGDGGDGDGDGGDGDGDGGDGDGDGGDGDGDGGDGGDVSVEEVEVVDEGG